ncbi:MAG: DUF427 domain-containing protein [Paracraurococcus sp.]|jgi:uncharacterized protein (DUF427 family)
MTLRPTERVADYPRPPRLEASDRHIRILLGGETIAETREAWRVLETFHPPSWYLPPDAFRPGVLRPAPGASLCEWKGRARYWTLVAGGAVATAAGWSYPDPTAAFADIQDHVAVYAGRMEACFVDGERVVPQPGGFYGGWITAELVGPFKGGPGTLGW